MNRHVCGFNGYSPELGDTCEGCTTPVPATPAPPFPDESIQCEATHEGHRCGRYAEHAGGHRYGLPFVAPVPEDREEATGIHNYIHAGPWALCYHCETAYEFGALHYCGAEWQTPRTDLPSTFVGRVKARAASRVALDVAIRRLVPRADTLAGQLRSDHASGDFGRALEERASVATAIADSLRLLAAAHGHTEGANG